MDTNFGSTAVASAAGATAGDTAAQAYLMQSQSASPLTGVTVTMTDDNKDRTLSLTPAGALADLTIAFPSDGASRIGQLVCITTTQTITTLAASGATVQGFATTAAANDFFTYQKISANTWRRR